MVMFPRSERKKMTDPNDEAIRFLEEAGRDDLADKLRAEHAVRDMDPEPIPEPNEAEAFLEELRAAQRRNTTSLPSLLDE
jgi:uncharacterized protein YqeY